MQLCSVVLLECSGLIPALLCLRQVEFLAPQCQKRLCFQNKQCFPLSSHFTSIPAASFPLNIIDRRGKKELMHWFDCI